MALIINSSKTLYASNGMELPTDLFCRFTFKPAFIGMSIDYFFKIYLSREVENTFSVTDVLWWEDIEQPVFDSEGVQTGTETIQSKRVFPVSSDAQPRAIKIDLTPQFVKATDLEVIAYFDSFKLTPFGMFLINTFTENTALTQVMFHVMAKNKLEEYFGVGSVTIRLDLI